MSRGIATAAVAIDARGALGRSELIVACTNYLLARNLSSRLLKPAPPNRARLQL
jgi:hypothetical protein